MLVTESRSEMNFPETNPASSDFIARHDEARTRKSLATGRRHGWHHWELVSGQIIKDHQVDTWPYGNIQGVTKISAGISFYYSEFRVQSGLSVEIRYV